MANEDSTATILLVMFGIIVISFAIGYSVGNNNETEEKYELAGNNFCENKNLTYDNYQLDLYNSILSYKDLENYKIYTYHVNYNDDNFFEVIDK